jgi:hypothetical protein
VAARAVRIGLILWALGVLSGGAAPAPEAGLDPAPGDSLQPPDLLTAIWQLYDSLPPPPFDGGCGLPPAAPFRLPERPASPSLGVVFTDGRTARWDSLEAHDGSLYWPMEEACSALDATLVWDAAHRRGRLLVDTLAIRFAVGEASFECADSTLRAGAPTLQFGDRLLLPLDALPLLVEAFLSPRFAYSRDSRLLVQRPALPPAELEVFTDVGRTHLVWLLDREPPARLWTDGGRTLVVELPGVGVDPQATPGGSAAGTCLRGVWPGPGGTRFVFRLDPSVRAWQTQWRRDRRTYDVILSTRREDLGRFESFPRWLPARQGESRTVVVLVMPGPSAPRGRRGGDARHDAANEFVCALGERIGEALEARGLSAVFIEDDPSADASRSAVARANASEAAAGLWLEADVCGDSLAAGYRIVGAVVRQGQRPLQPLEIGGAQGGRASPGEAASALRPWESVAPEHAEPSDDLAWLLDLHLRAAQMASGLSEPFPRIVRQHWPGGPLEGLDMPGAVLYVGRSGPEPLFPSERDWNDLERVGEAIALSVEAFLAWGKGR